MPKSQRKKAVIISKTGQVGKEFKKRKSLLVEKIQTAVDDYERIIIIELINQRNHEIKQIRTDLSDGKFIFGKNKVIAVALGRTRDEEIKENLHKIGEHLHGECGLIFTNRPRDEVLLYFRSFKHNGFARAGSKASQTVVIPAGTIKQNEEGCLVTVTKSEDDGLLAAVPLSMEPLLRSFGLPTFIKDASIKITSPYTVCHEDEILSEKQCQILKRFGYKLSTFEIIPRGIWEKETEIFEELKG
ncbi:putative mRNA turnover protein 4 [Monocercomonoides exilis]|uniref:putative mRNA turnover protein 4 n=1 Tax=Monocercomonoides exilis TaxID=2049356 RepID=UPI0035597555|nr:putative mRNA turnover protein 4 [Monocercomonoides exilis]|eukprot:MONOS_5102.1-p1 / transcript=MONOS_5102.1 / gene=MONOS_5102 / organism=Monocercomonoides_exilis_PA203 / gene_product=mRNA turnover protein 4 homolog / transcript_product=mRNA turnover protein 4 homolog / location=Mono_scaffold00145:19609-20629(+) / protein_length=243 / sequence_SO=supercontig / SO=protein_coding / is_pseudo=false